VTTRILGYGERAAPADLAGVVVCTWLGYGRSAPSRILPDGCADVIWAPGRAPFVAGPDTHAKLETLPPGPRVGIRFRTGAAGALLGLPARAIRDLRVPLAELWPREAALRLAEALAASDTFECRLAALEAAVRERARSASAPDPTVLAAAAAIGRRVRAGAAGAAGEPAGAVPVGERQLRRRFADAVGYGPKQLERVLRLQHFLGLARAPVARPLAELALAAGYADQPHLGRECRDLAGLTPAALRAG
jgi:AraC-like DNA-binding protein